MPAGCTLVVAASCRTRAGARCVTAVVPLLLWARQLPRRPLRHPPRLARPQERLGLIGFRRAGRPASLIVSGRRLPVTAEGTPRFPGENPNPSVAVGPAGPRLTYSAVDSVQRSKTRLLLAFGEAGQERLRVTCWLGMRMARWLLAWVTVLALIGTVAGAVDGKYPFMVGSALVFAGGFWYFVRSGSR